jgi:hypothetical protein
MKITDILSELQTILEDHTDIGSQCVPVVNSDANYNQIVESALRDVGVAIVLTLMSGAQTAPAKAPFLQMSNRIMVTVVENRAKNDTGKTCLEWAEVVMETLHFREWREAGIMRSVVSVDTPAYEQGSLDGGLVTYHIYISVPTLQKSSTTT